jgi:hypothetical protein
MKLKNLCLGAALGFMAYAVQAESDINSSAGAAISATARLNMRVTVPRMLFLRVGRGTNFADSTLRDRVTFTVSAANVGSGLPIAGVNTPAGPLVARVLSNGGNVSFRARGPAGGLAKGTRRIPWTQIVASTSGGTLPHPVIGNGVAGPVTALGAVAGVVDQTSTWTFNYSNSNPVEFGTYNGRVTYTASVP